MKILIIEDERPINNLIRSTLTADGYSCDCAFDGKEGADLIEQRQYDLILLDLMLPEISGYDLLEYIRSLGNIRAAKSRLLSSPPWDRCRIAFAAFIWARMIICANLFRSGSLPPESKQSCAGADTPMKKSR